MEPALSPLTYKQLLDEFGQRIVLLLEIYRYEQKDIAGKLDIHPGNLIGVLKETKGKRASRKNLIELLRILNESYPAELEGFKVNTYQDFKLYFFSPEEIAQSTGTSYLNIGVKVEELEITLQAQFIVLMRRLAAAGVNVENLDEDIENEKNEIRSKKNNPQ